MSDPETTAAPAPQGSGQDDKHEESCARMQCRVLHQQVTDLDLKWNAASQFVRDVVFALGESEPSPDAVVDLPAIALQVVGQIEDFKQQVTDLQLENTQKSDLLRQIVMAWDSDESIEFLEAITLARQSVGLKLADADEEYDDVEVLRANKMRTSLRELK